MELCIPQFFEEAGLFVISRSTVQIRVLAPEKSRGYIKRCNPFLVTVRKTVRKLSARPFYTNAARDLAQFSARFGTPLTCASIVLAHCMQRARRKISRLSAFRLSELHAYSRYHFWASCSGTSPYSPLSDSKSQIPLFNFFARPI